MGPKQKLISADSHVGEPAELYKRLPEELWSRWPKIAPIDGTNWIVADGYAIRPADAPNALTKDDERREFRPGSGTLEQERYVGTDLSRRVSDIVEDGVSGEVIYPNGIFHCFVSPDPSHQMTIAKLYNDFYWEVFGEHTDMFIPSAVLPTIDVGSAIIELHRISKIGYRSISVPVSLSSDSYNSESFNSLWAAIEKTSIPLSFHVFTRNEAVLASNLLEKRGSSKVGQGMDMIFIVKGMAEAMNPLLMLTASGALDRHPNLKFVLVEGGTGWLAWSLYAMDDIYKRRHMWQIPKLELLPSEYFLRQGYVTFADDPVGLHNIEYTGVECMMWGSDYPHDEGTFPHSQDIIDETFQQLTKDQKRKIVCDNAARLYGIPV